MSIVNDECKVNFVLKRNSTIYYIFFLPLPCFLRLYLFLYFAPSFFLTTVFSPLLCFSQHSEYALSFRPSLSNHSFHKILFCKLSLNCKILINFELSVKINLGDMFSFTFFFSASYLNRVGGLLSARPHSPTLPRRLATALGPGLCCRDRACRPTGAGHASSSTCCCCTSCPSRARGQT